MTKITLPFMHRFAGRTPKNDKIRYLAAWDSVEVDIPECLLAGFDRGAILLPERTTFSRDGEHWAFFDERILGIDRPTTSLADLPLHDLRVLIGRVGPSTFFDEGATHLRHTDILLRTPSTRLVEFSQRHSIVERLKQYARENMADVGGRLMVRVHEPSLTLNAWCRPNKPNEKAMCYLQLHVAKLAPWQAQRHDGGLHYSINELDELLELASSLVTPQSECDELMVMCDRKHLDRLELLEEPIEDMNERSVRAIAGNLVARRERQLSQATGSLARLSAMILKVQSEMSEDDHNELLDVMMAFQPKMNLAERMIVRLAEERWNDRPLSIGNIVKARGQTPGA
jgi:hypothetical protein